MMGEDLHVAAFAAAWMQHSGIGSDDAHSGKLLLMFEF
jgi:hypothetical protein